MRHLTTAELEPGLPYIRESPRDSGVLKLIVQRPAIDRREVIEHGQLDPEQGLVGDTWKARLGPRTHDTSPDPDTQLTLMNARVIDLIANARERWALSGDQLYVDLDLSAENLPPGTELAVGSAVIEVVSQPHTGCSKFVARFGLDAMRWVNSPVGRELHLRGIYAKVVRPGAVRAGDVVLRV